MKFFHLADLHFGKTMHGFSMIEQGDQPFWTDQIINKAKELQPDVVVISGDVYDRAVPSKDAVRLLDKFLTELSKLQIPVLMIAGNHDSGSRLEFAEELLCRQGIHIAGEIQKEIRCVTFTDAWGTVRFWLVPYLFPAAVNQILDRNDLKDYDSAMRALLDEQNICPEERNIILSHQFVTAGFVKPEMGGSETTVGGIGQIDAEVFHEFDYVALGHIHNAQRMGREGVRYAGSPLCYHFSEAGQKKGLTVVELKEKGNLTISIEEIPVLHQLCELSGTVEELLEMKPEKNCYIKAVVKQEILPPRMLDTLRIYYEKQGCTLMEAVREYTLKPRPAQEQVQHSMQQLSIEEHFQHFYSYLHEGELPEESLQEILIFAAEQIRNCGSDETESEHRKKIKELIAFAGAYKEDTYET